MASPQFEAFLQASLAQRTDAPPDIAELRAAGDALAQILQPPEGTEVSPTDAAGVPAEWVSVPGVSEDRVIFHLHGGGYCIWSPRPYRNFNGRLSRATDARVLAVDYRLAPEHPHPAAVDDAVTAYRWLLDGGTAPESIAITGDSAGGGLTVATLVALREAGLPLPACAVPVSPWVDMELSGEVSDAAREVDVLSLDHLKVFADAYLAGTDARAPLANPLHADLDGLPPMLVLVGEREVLLDDAKRLIARAKDAGADATLHVAPEMTHIWQMFGGMFPEAEEAVERIASFVNAKLSER
ncbi:MAG: alpha/beta hydrolase [Candidatus Binatia bacterium]